MGSGGIAFSEGSPCLQQADKLHSDKNATKQAFPKEPGFRLLGTGYINTDKPPCTHAYNIRKWRPTQQTATGQS